MKKYFSLIFLLTILFSGCNQEELLNNQSTISESRTFTASFEQNESRTYIEEGNLLRWTEGDQISLFEGNTLNRQYQFDGKTGDNSGTFSLVVKPFGTGNDLTAHYAVYPYASNIKITEKGVITATLPAEQSYAENSFGLGANTMVAVTEDIDDSFLPFKNVGGYLKLQLYGDNVTVKSITLTGNSGEKLAGKATITPIYGENPTINMTDEATESITLNCGDGIKIGTTAETATKFWIVVPPTIFENGFNVVVTNSEGQEFVKSTSNEINISRNVIKPMSAFKVEYITPLPDLSGTWRMDDILSEGQLYTLTLASSSNNSASYNISPNYGVNSLSVGVSRNTSGKITVSVHVVSASSRNDYYDGTLNEDLTTVTGTYSVYSPSNGNFVKFDSPWTIYRSNN